jgi:hypothetical protein
MGKKITILIIFGFFGGLLISFVLYQGLSNKSTFFHQETIPSSTNSSTVSSELKYYVSTSSKDITGISQNLNIININDRKLIYSIINTGQIKEKGTITQFYNIELTNETKSSISESIILQISQKILPQVLTKMPDAKKIMFFYFSDKSLVHTSPPDLGYVIWDKENNEFSYHFIRTNIKPIR